MIVDPDEFMTSRAHPHISIRELLTERFDECGIVAAPWLVYTWGNMSSNPKNSARSQLHYRLGYGKKYAVPIIQDRYSKFHNPVDGGW